MQHFCQKILEFILYYLEISFYLAVHSYACGDVAQLLGQAFLVEVDGAKHGSMCWFHNRPTPGSAMTLRNSDSSAAWHSNPNEGTSFEQNFAFAKIMPTDQVN